MPFSLDRLAIVPRYVYHGSYMTKCDDLATIMFPYHRLLRLVLASNRIDSGLFVLHYLLGGKSPRIYTIPLAR